MLGEPEIIKILEQITLDRKAISTCYLESNVVDLLYGRRILSAMFILLKFNLFN